MARSANNRATDGDSRVSAPPDRAEVRDLSDPRELSLEEVLKSYEQPINEEQAWAVCYQCCSGLSVPLLAAETRGLSRVKDPSSILLYRDGTVSLQKEPSTGNGRSLFVYLFQQMYCFDLTEKSKGKLYCILGINVLPHTLGGYRLQATTLLNMLIHF